MAAASAPDGRPFAGEPRVPGSLNGRIAIVTGGTQGLGEAIARLFAERGAPFIAAYCASKGALATLTRNVAHSLVKFHIRVNGLNIGWMSTPGEDRIMKTYHGAKDGWLEEAVRVRPFGRLVDPKEVARAC